MARKRPEKSYYTPNEVADLFMVSPITVREWAKKGLLKAELTPGGHRRFLLPEVQKFARQRDLSLQERQDFRTRILIVDDDRQFCRYLSEHFSAHDESIVTECAFDGFSAGQCIPNFRPHIVLLDLMMAGIDGFEVCRKLKGDPDTKKIRVIAMTGFASDENKQKVIEAGAECCLSKPIDITELSDVLDKNIIARQKALYKVKSDILPTEKLQAI